MLSAKLRKSGTDVQGNTSLFITKALRQHLQGKSSGHAPQSNKTSCWPLPRSAGCHTVQPSHRTLPARNAGPTGRLEITVKAFLPSFCEYLLVRESVCVSKQSDSIFTYIYTHTHIYIYVHVCMYACMHVCMYACMHVCMYVCMYVCMLFSHVFVHGVHLLCMFICVNP